MPGSVTGSNINYYFICKRKLWLFAHSIQMEQESENQTLLGTKVDLASRKGIKPAYFEFVKKDLIYA